MNKSTAVLKTNTRLELPKFNGKTAKALTKPPRPQKTARDVSKSYVSPKNSTDVFKQKKLVMAKTLLRAFPYFEKHLTNTHQVIQTSASTAYCCPDTYDLCEMIIEATVRSDNLHNIKARMLNLMDTMKNGQTLKMFYADSMTAASIAELQKCEMRSVFRRLETATRHFAEKLDVIGINLFTFKELLRQNKWLVALSNRFRNEN